MFWEFVIGFPMVFGYVFVYLSMVVIGGVWYCSGICFSAMCVGFVCDCSGVCLEVVWGMLWEFYLVFGDFSGIMVCDVS